MPSCVHLLSSFPHVLYKFYQFFVVSFQKHHLVPTLRMILGQEVEKTGAGIYHIILDADRAELTGKTFFIFQKMISSPVIVYRRTGLE